MARTLRQKKVKAGDVLLATPGGQAAAIMKTAKKRKESRETLLRLAQAGKRTSAKTSRAAKVQKDLALQRAKVKALQLAVKNERNLVKKTGLASQLHVALTKLTVMVLLAKGQKKRAQELAQSAVVRRGTRLAPASSGHARPPGSHLKYRALIADYIKHLAFERGLSRVRPSRPVFNVTPEEARLGITPQIRKAQLEAAFLALGKREIAAGRAPDIVKRLIPTIVPMPVPQQDAEKVLSFVRDMTADAVAPSERASTTDAGSAERLANSEIPAEPAALTDADVDKAVVEAEAAEAEIESSGDVAAEAAEEVDVVAAQPDAAAVAEQAQQAVSAAGGLNMKTIAIGAAIAAGVYFLVLKK